MQATRSTRPAAHTWPEWATGARTKTKRFPLTVSAASISSSRPTYTDPVCLLPSKVLRDPMDSMLTVTFRYQLPLLRLREPSRDGRIRENGQESGLRRLRSAELRRLAHRHGGEAGQCLDDSVYFVERRRRTFKCAMDGGLCHALSVDGSGCAKAVQGE